ncbi:MULTISPECIES: GNAT family N-acetyltransferase [unclassified Sinorhizobium]|uniref:GNAT family N-acetyltransferase n=1 Tax=unclassified Sinorhizobium TaxID=2613772 RepID=UPI0024C44A74|nr:MULTISPECIES: GNAT family N-acetyltransferase [unclassified Sinorhizobium]MDK1376335.1 GNAT family N-acetyltransferase [Sinorhizobium sp. 6-70]MDK1478140.1 GNAT family N-acetyltransferase [Sinorhizobium sp. 6-117]
MTETIRHATRAELDTIIDWAAREGWNPGLEDANAFWAADPEGYWVSTEEGALAAAISLVRYGTDYAFLGFYVAHPAYRGRGFGLALWTRAIAEAGERTIGLDGVVAQQENYRKSGFVRSHANIRYGGVVDVKDPPGTNLIDAAPIHAPALIEYDRSFNPASRDAFLREWAKQLKTRRSVVLLRDGTITGYGTLRACREGFKIGPLFADTETGADLIFRKLAAGAKGGQIYLDIPEPNASAKALCERYNMKPVFETARMYRGPAPDLPLERIYGITTFELG